MNRGVIGDYAINIDPSRLKDEERYECEFKLIPKHEKGELLL